MVPRKPRKPQAIDHLAGSINNWIARHNLKSDPYLTGLRDAIESKGDLHIWAELDPTEYLPHPDARINFSKARRVRLFAVIRNVLVFAPVALTWAAVSEATSAFSEYVKNNGADVVNFLDFWQNGYGILGSEWRIGNVARLDFLIVVIVIALTLYVSQAGHTLSSAKRAAEDVIDAERLALAIEIHAALNDKKKISNVTMNASLAGAISRLVAATKTLEGASRNIEKTSRKLPKERDEKSFLDSFSFDSSLSAPKGRKSRRA